VPDEPKLRLAKKGQPPPYPLNELGKPVLLEIAKRLFAAKYIRNLTDFTGDEWERAFAESIGAEWHPSNVGLDDIQLANTCWGAKTVKSKHPDTQEDVRLISGRNSLTFSYEEDNILSADPQELGSRVLQIYNGRVDGIFARFAHCRMVVLLKGPELTQCAVFEFEITRFRPEDFLWSWNQNKNLVAVNGEGVHRFTWQPHGSQFTIVQPVPDRRNLITLDVPDDVEPFSMTELLSKIGFQNEWVRLD
jgi:hypothetical protein